MDRRTFLTTTTMIAGGFALSGAFAFAQTGTKAAAKPKPKIIMPEVFEVTHTDAEWRKILSDDAYMVMRQEDTEPPGYSPLEGEARKGVYDCASCDLPLFASETKYHSGTGWPSFYAPIDKAVLTKTDTLIGEVRTEVHCRRCGGHLGHIFPDGPRPTGLRYCINGVALKFVAA